MNSEIINKKDYLLISVIGFLSSLCALPVLKGIQLSFLHLTAATSILIVVFFVLFSPFALWVVSSIGKKLSVLLQVTKFSATGVLNTLLDFGILNGLMIITGIKTGLILSIFSGISFVAATVNSYFWNKYWTFSSGEKGNLREASEFLVVSTIGLFINLSIFSAIVYSAGFFGLSSFTPERWDNMAKLVATVFSLIWNFLGYKFIVFRKGRPRKPEILPDSGEV